LSEVASTFIIDANSKFKPDPNKMMDDASFGNDIPTLPQWTGPPRAIVRVQAILLASLAASLLSAFLALLGKQWLNRYPSIDIRGSAIEHNQHRQRKLDGIVGWYLDHVIVYLLLMSQGALLLLVYALSQYLWDTLGNVALIILGLHLVFCLFGIYLVGCLLHCG
jgi:hypothetical protein